MDQMNHIQIIQNIWVLISDAKPSSHTSWNQVLWRWLCLNAMIERVMIHGHRVSIMCGECVYIQNLYCKKIKIYVWPKRCFSKLFRHVETIQKNGLSFPFPTCMENAIENAVIKCQGMFGGTQLPKKHGLLLWWLVFCSNWHIHIFEPILRWASTNQAKTKSKTIQHSPGTFSIIHTNF